MARNANNLILEINLPSDFETMLTNEVKDEIKIAEQKWRTILSDEQIEKAQENSLKQLQAKVSQIAGANWRLKDQTIKVSIGHSKPATIQIPSKLDAATKTMRITRSTNSFDLVTESSKEKETDVPISAFYNFFLNECKLWIRTAAYYGVGSYSG